MMTLDPTNITEGERDHLKAKTPILIFFDYAHLPKELQDVSRPLCELAYGAAASLPSGAELSAGLRKLLEAKDCLVRAKLQELAPGKASTLVR